MWAPDPDAIANANALENDADVGRRSAAPAVNASASQAIRVARSHLRDRPGESRVGVGPPGRAMCEHVLVALTGTEQATIDEGDP